MLFTKQFFSSQIRQVLQQEALIKSQYKTKRSPFRYRPNGLQNFLVNTNAQELEAQRNRARELLAEAEQRVEHLRSIFSAFSCHENQWPKEGKQAFMIGR